MAPDSKTPDRSLRILFVVEPGALLRFALLVPALAERGHEVRIAFAAGKVWRRHHHKSDSPLPARTVALAEELQARFPGLISYGPAPERPQSEGWHQVAWLVRALADLAHNAQPRYAGAKVLRRRTQKCILGPLREAAEFDPIGRRLVLRLGMRLTEKTDERLSKRVLSATARLEDAIPSSNEVDAYVREVAPDVVVATGTFRHVSSEVEFLKSARRLGIPSASVLTSWDNLTNKGSLKFAPERVIVWNDIQVRDAVELHGIPPDRLRTTGAHVFDAWFERRPTRTKEELLAELGLDPAEPYVVYLCSSRNIARPSEVEFVKRWVDTLRSSPDKRLRRINIVVRPHPNADRQWQGVKLDAPGAVIWPAEGAHPVAAQARADFFDTIAHSAAVVGINTTAMIEAAILGKSVLTVLVREFRQETTLHFHYLLAENGGFLHVAPSLDEHTAQLRSVLDEDEAGAERRARFIESFVRPGGIDRPAAPLTAAAIEEAAGVPVRNARGAGARLLRMVLSVEAGLTDARGLFLARRSRPQA